ncbi:MAG TPA: D-aminoacylase [Polyangiaceae bacterium]|nr:D-aminoacylase [Polyangiaceae bacterium]
MRRAALAPLLLLTVCVEACGSGPARPGPAPAFDLVVAHGRVVDGTGSPARAADVGIRGGHVVAVGDLGASPRARTIDASGLVVAPGFIDMLGQSEMTLLVDPRAPSKIYQGVTTEITGEGDSIAPTSDEIVAKHREDFDSLQVTCDWRTFRDYFARLEKQGIGINIASYVGATQVRRVVLGEGDVQPTAAQLEAMRALVRDAMHDGAMGVSTSLLYPPAPYAKTEELVALASEAAKLGGIYATHMRDEADHEMAAIDEALRIGREAKIPVEIWHIKAAGKKNWGRMKEIIAKIDDARAHGLDVSANTYAYPAWGNGLSAILPPAAQDGGDEKTLARLADPAQRARIKQEILAPTSSDWQDEWQQVPAPESWLVCGVDNDALRSLQGKTLAQLAAEWHEDGLDAALDLIVKDHAHTSVAVFAMNEDDIAYALKQPWVSIGVDSPGVSSDGLLGKWRSHPRGFGAFPRILRKYVREEHLLTLEEAIRKFTSLPAARMHIADRGSLEPGKWADVVVFDPQTVRDVATFEDPNRYAVGMKYVLVNGVPVIEEGSMTGATPGRVIRGPGHADAPAR